MAVFCASFSAYFLRLDHHHHNRLFLFHCFPFPSLAFVIEGQLIISTALFASTSAAVLLRCIHCWPLWSQLPLLPLQFASYRQCPFFLFPFLYLQLPHFSFPLFPVWASCPQLTFSINRLNRCYNLHLHFSSCLLTFFCSHSSHPPVKEGANWHKHRAKLSTQLVNSCASEDCVWASLLICRDAAIQWEWERCQRESWMLKLRTQLSTCVIVANTTFTLKLRELRRRSDANDTNVCFSSIQRSPFLSCSLLNFVCFNSGIIVCNAHGDNDTCWGGDAEMETSIHLGKTNAWIETL